MSIYDENVCLDDLLSIKWMFEQQQKIAHFGTWEWDIQKNISRWSEESYKIYGIEQGTSLNYETVADFRHPDDRELAERTLKKAIEEGSQYDLEYRIIRKTGEVRFIRGYGKVYADSDGKPQKIFGTVQDVTEKKQVEWDRALKANLLFAVNEAIIAADANGVLKFISRSAEKAFGISAGEFIGFDYKEFLKRFRIECPVQEVRDQLTAEGSSVFEISFDTDEGQKWHEIRSSVVRDDHGVIIGVVCAARDVTQRKVSQAAINRQNTILKQTNLIYKHALSCETAQSLADMCLDVIRSVTGSPIGFIGEIDKEGSRQTLAGQALNWDIMKGIETQCGRGLHEDAVVINDVQPYEPSAGPLKIHTFLSIPYQRGGRIAGLLVAANRKGGYTWEQKEMLEALAPAIIEALATKRATELLRDNELLLRTIMESASDFMFLKDKSSRVVMVNQAYGRVFNVDIKDVVGKDDYELYPDFDMASQVIENDRQVMESGKMQICQESAMTADGYKTFSLSKVPWRDINGDIIGVLGVAHDVTELNETKDSLQNTVTSLKHSKQYIELLYEITGKILTSTTPRRDIDYICDKVMRFLDCDAYFNYLYFEDEAYLRLNACKGISPDAMKEVELLPVGAAVCGFALQQRCRIVAEHIQQAEDQRTDFLKSIGVRAYACHPLMAGNEIFGTLAFGTRKKDSFKEDELMLMKAVAESAAVSLRRKRTEEKLCEQAKELEQKNRLITDFFINVSHEFKTPLTIIKLAAELLEYNMKNEKPEKISSYLGMIRSNSNRLTKLVGNLLDITKVDAGFMSPKRSLVDIVGLLENIVQSIRLYASKRALAVDFLSNLPSRLIFTDSGFIERIALNLLSNAIKHTHKGGSIGIELHTRGNKMLLAVKDNGEGIPDDKKDIIFDRFRQVNTSLARSNEGCGIGLALSKSLTELLGGRIWLKSEYGKGSSFFVELPYDHTNSDQTVVTSPENIESTVAIEFSDISFY